MSDKLNIILCWHMHQPWYRESIDGNYRLPWVYLHALKDYTDMASHLEMHPAMKCVVNFTPVLIEQIQDYADQCQNWLDKDQPFYDPLLAHLSGALEIPDCPDQRLELVRACLKANATQMINPFPTYRKMVDMVILDGDQNKINEPALSWFSNQFFVDLLTWYHIAWLGYSLRQNELVQSLIKQGSHFSAKQRRDLISLFADTFNELLPRYKTLSDSGQVELSMTPYAHPIMPLLIDFASMKDTLPEAPVPAYELYPDGMARADWHMEYGIKIFQKAFGCKPKGVWLSEGAVSEAAVRLLQKHDILWTASGEGVWHNSTYLSDIDTHDPATRKRLFSCNQLPDCTTRMFFRDDGLSDMIGFEYQSWNASDAAADFVNHLNNIAAFTGDDAADHVASVILDGENAWEYYPDNAWHFLQALYQGLTNNDKIQPLTYSEVCHSCPTVTLPRLCAGSWVYGSFSTWIGEVDKNLGWDLLVEAKQAYDANIAKLSKTDQQQALLQLAICEGSDWFWWFGDYNPGDSVRDFDQLYRLQLARLYDILKLPQPEKLNHPVSVGGGNADNGGTMRRGHEH